MEKKRILDTWITTGSYSDFVDQVFHLAEGKKSSYVCFSNVHMLIEAHKDRAFNDIVSKSDMSTPDGVPLRIAMRLLYGVRQERIAGMDALPDLLQEAEKRKKKVFFYGGTQQVLDAMNNRIKRELPHLSVAGSYSPPFRKLTESEERDVIDMINGSEADLIFVALGCPKQERWAAAHQGKIKGCILAVGAAFAVYAGQQSRAPKWMQTLSLEWFYRFTQEPGRLWKRYLLTNSLFLFLFVKNYILKNPL